ncbi:Uu.00g064830.m01.CDS01 [Anthostomella pinea]|uniref:Uu.00g064830.m01.CDS01 n=1 Tax=Anthostomella pinea TaxID=933095 RepID=A0AAI8VUV7_9PEZI|nr:Uu.00g064830.m01.CDS01 [Anthostomella pinea]
MASNQPLAVTPKPLSMMTELSPLVSIYESKNAAVPPSTSAPAPRLILMASWMDAQDVHIAKYITQYQAIYPTSSILLVKFFMKEILFVSMAQKAVQTAISYLRSQIDAGTLSASPTQPEILVHLFSNGGAISMREIYLSFKQTTGGQPFPSHTAVFDSCPGVYSSKNVYNAFLLYGFPQGLKRMIARPFVAMLVLTLWVFFRPLRFLAGEDPLAKSARILNDRRLVRQTNRAYVYGTVDTMVDCRHVDAHAKAAVAKGYDVRREVYERSPHVSHMRTDTERYWKIFTEIWEKAVSTV